MRAAPDTESARSATLHPFDLGVVPYEPVQDLQGRLRRAVSLRQGPAVLLLLEHEPVITLGTHALRSDVHDQTAAAARGVRIAQSDRGGQCTLHAPGQLVSYPILPIPHRDLRAYVHDLEEVLLVLLRALDIDAHRSDKRPGLFCGGRKIASLGLRCEHGIASHGTALNVSNDLSLFDLITSCGEPGLRQISVQQAAGRTFTVDEFKAWYIEAFRLVFGATLAPLRRLSYALVEDSLRLTALPTEGACKQRLMPTAGFEPATPGSGGQCSIP